jgi:hypothetical protein
MMSAAQERALAVTLLQRPEELRRETDDLFTTGGK